MKKLSIILLLLALSLPSRGQFFKFAIGLEGGGLYNYILYNPTPSPDHPSNFSSDPMKGICGYGGLNIDFKFGKVFGLRIGGHYLYCSSGFKIVNTDSPIALNQQYIAIPTSILLWMGKAAAFEIGAQQSMLLSSTYHGDLEASPDESAYKYQCSVIGGFRFNLGKTVYITLRGSYGITPFYHVGEPFTNITGSVGLGFNIYRHKKNVFK